MICDNKTGQCIVPPAMNTATAPAARTTGHAVAVHYVGDPMCSWCWGVASAIKALEAWCQAHGFRFVVTAGGLRAGGGDEWNSAFRRFLRDEWKHIHNVTGQPFSYALLERDAFDYDTEPACRAVVSASLIRPEAKLTFFHATQSKFYTESGDPKEVDFYQSVCEKTAIPFTDFKTVFESERAALETTAEFTRARQLGVSAFPSFLVEKSGVIRNVACGYINEHDIIERVSQAEAQL